MLNACEVTLSLAYICILIDTYYYLSPYLVLHESVLKSSSLEQLIRLVVRCEEAVRCLSNFNPDHVMFQIWNFVNNLFGFTSACLNFLSEKLSKHPDSISALPPCDGHLWKNLRSLIKSVDKSFHKAARYLNRLPSPPDLADLGEKQDFESVMEDYFSMAIECLRLVDELSGGVASSSHDEGLWCDNAECNNLCGPSEMRLKTFACGGRCGVRYCSRACQEAGWRAGHKTSCRTTRDSAD